MTNASLDLNTQQRSQVLLPIWLLHHFKPTLPYTVYRQKSNLFHKIFLQSETLSKNYDNETLNRTFSAPPIFMLIGSNKQLTRTI